MTKPRVRSELARLFRQAESAHRAAVANPNGDDSDWPIWYAQYLEEPLREVAGISMDRSRLIYCLMNAGYEHETRAADIDWAEFTADYFLECYAASDTPADDNLALYYMPGCPYCVWVLRAIEGLDLNLELRNILENHSYRDDLVNARGRATVPVLRISSPDGADRWMPESRDIVHYLKKTYG